MSEMSSIKFKEDGIYLTLKISKEEYELLGNETADILVVPAGVKSMNKVLTTGKLGNSTRLMLPKKAMDTLGLKVPDKKVLGKLFRIKEGVYIVVRLAGAKK